VLLGLALCRSQVVSARPAITLAGAALGFAAFEGPFVPVLRALSTMAAEGAHAWVAWRYGEAPGTSARPTGTAGRSRLGPAEVGAEAGRGSHASGRRRMPRSP
jgi:hypothetical protein